MIMYFTQTTVTTYLNFVKKEDQLHLIEQLYYGVEFGEINNINYKLKETRGVICVEHVQSKKNVCRENGRVLFN